MMDGCDQCWKKTRATGSGSARARQEDPGSSYIWLSGKVTSNLSQIPNNFCLFLPEILNSGQSVSHDFQKRNFHVINHLSERSERTKELSFLRDSTWFYAISVPFTYCLVHSTTRDLNFEGTLSSLANLWC